MRIKTKILIIITWAMMMIFMFTGSPYVHARLAGNHTETAFNEEDPPDPSGSATVTTSTASFSIKNLIILGASEYLKASQEINRLSNEYEMIDINGVDIQSLKDAVNAAIASMESARGYYRQLVKKASQTPYNWAVIVKLLVFDYRTFRIDNGLNKQIFGEVEDYLAYGDAACP